MGWWHLRKRDQDVERELQSDLDLEEEEQRELGESPEEARHAALRAFGNPTVISEQTRAVWSWNVLESLLRDLRISVRTLFRSPGFSLIAVIVIALCIGAATSLFTVVRSVLLRPLPFRDPSRLVMIYEHFRDPEDNAHGSNYNPVAPADYRDWRAQTRGFEDMAAWRYGQFKRQPGARLRSAVVDIGVGRVVRSPFLPDDTAHGRGWRSHGAWCEAGAGSAPAAGRRPASSALWADVWPRHEHRSGTHNPVDALWNPSARSGHLHGRRCNSTDGGGAGLPRSGVEGVADRTNAGIANGMRRRFSGTVWGGGRELT